MKCKAIIASLFRHNSHIKSVATDIRNIKSSWFEIKSYTRLVYYGAAQMVLHNKGVPIKKKENFDIPTNFEVCS